MAAKLDVEPHLDKRRELINSRLKERRGNPAGMDRSIRHYTEAGGKRLRPILTMLVGEAFGASTEDVVPAGVAVETIHEMSLIHDDLIDGDEKRRGVPTVHREFSDDVALVTGDYLFGEAFNSITDIPVPNRSRIQILRTMSEAVTSMCEGQMLDVELERKSEPVGISEYLRMSQLKTGALFGACSHVGAICADVAPQEASRMGDMGWNLGTAFQIYDDLLDIKESETGKDFGSDLKNGKATAVTITARNKGVDVFDQSISVENRVEEIRRKDVHADVQALANEFVSMARTHVNSIPDGEEKEIIKKLLDKVTDREK